MTTGMTTRSPTSAIALTPSQKPTMTTTELSNFLSQTRRTLALVALLVAGSAQAATFE